MWNDPVADEQAIPEEVVGPVALGAGHPHHVVARVEVLVLAAGAQVVVGAHQALVPDIQL